MVKAWMPVNSGAPILVIDSGLGGLTVVKAVHALMPHEQIVYFGDTARLPYGSKSAETVTTFVKQIISYLRGSNPKHVLIACNTATALALPALKRHFGDLSISGVVDPGAKAAVEAAGPKETPVIGVMATEATIGSKAYDRAIITRRPRARLLLRPAPLLVPIIEEGRAMDDPLVQLSLEQYLKPMIDRRMDVLVLGCTHYPLLKPLIQQIVGMDVRVIDSAEQCAEDVARRLQAAELLRGEDPEQTTRKSASSWLKTFVTDNSPRFAKLASRFLGIKIDSPRWVHPDELHAATIEPSVREAV
ncbi:MAG TPA: glutamate racemase [Tepidisphaeraceae bacterium]|jgi:glutamate racemase|nr:glutamate racemase [Tepidisphaeraceae bacterium]